MKHSIAIVLTLTLLIGVAPAKKPDHTGGGGGGGDTAAYTIIPFLPPDLETVGSQVLDLNETGQAVGRADLFNGPGGALALHFDVADGVYTTLTGGSVAEDVNNLNQTVGCAQLPELTEALFWSSPSADPVILPPMPGGQNSYAYAINDAGMIVGSSDTQGVVWQVVVDEGGIVHVSGPVVLPALAGAAEWSAVDIGETVDGAAVAAGYSVVDSSWESTVWLVELDPEDGTLVFNQPAVGLGQESFSFANNTFGDVCGQSSGLPFIALAGQGIQSLPQPRNTQWGRAMGVNNLGDVVGQLDIYRNSRSGPGNFHAYLWRDGAAIDLETQVDLGGWDQFWGANVINDTGVIVGWGRYDVESRGFILIPN